MTHTAATGLLQWARTLGTPPSPEPTLEELEAAADAALLAASRSGHYESCEAS